MELPERSFSDIHQHIKNQYHPHQKIINNLEIRNLVYWISHNPEHAMHHLQEEKWSIFPSSPNLRIGLWRRSVLHMFGQPDNCFHLAISYFALGCGCTTTATPEPASPWSVNFSQLSRLMVKPHSETLLTVTGSRNTDLPMWSQTPSISKKHKTCKNM